MSGSIWPALFVLLFAVVIAVLAWWRLQADKLNAKLSGESINWPTATGEITAARIDVDRTMVYDNNTSTRSENVRYQPKVEYAYTVGGQQYLGSRINFTILDFISENRAQKVIDKYPVGASLPVAYEPANPNNSVLDRDTKPRAVNLSTMMLFFLTAVMIALGVGLLFIPIT